MENTHSEQKTRKRFEFIAVELADWNSYTIIDNESKKIVCHLLPDNGAEYCNEIGNKIAELLNSNPVAVDNIQVATCKKGFDSRRHWCVGCELWETCTV